MGKADLHIHTTYGDGMAEIDELLDYADAGDLDVIAVTEHDELRAALDAREQWARGSHRFELIVGEEVTALQGHLVALFVEEPLPSLRPLEEVLAAIHRQGGLAIIPHPLSWLTRSVGRRAIERVLALGGNDGVYFDAIETANLSLAGRITMERARRLNDERFHFAAVGASDAHFLEAVGSAYTTFEGRTAVDLRRAILEKTTASAAGHYPSLREIGWRKVMVQQYRGIMSTPRAMGWVPTIKSFVKRALP